MTQHEGSHSDAAQSHRDAAEKLLTERNDGYPHQGTEALRRALVHATLAVAYAKAE